MNKPVIIVGASEFGKAALEIFLSNEVVVYGFLDDNKELHGTEIQEIPVLGSTDNQEFIKLIGENCDVFLAFDDNALKATLIKTIRKDQKAMPVNAIHRHTMIASSAIMHHGTFVNQGVTIGANANIGNHCILHSGAIVDYSATLGDFVQVGTGSTICAGAKVEDGVFIGSGATIVSGVTVKEGSRIGAGSVVIADVEKKATVFGNPAKLIE